MAFLDKEGLKHFWNNIKTYVNKRSGVEVGTIVNVDKNATTPEGFEDVNGKSFIYVYGPAFTLTSTNSTLIPLTNTLNKGGDGFEVLADGTVKVKKDMYACIRGQVALTTAITGAKLFQIKINGYEQSYQRVGSLAAYNSIQTDAGIRKLTKGDIIGLYLLGGNGDITSSSANITYMTIEEVSEPTKPIKKVAVTELNPITGSIVDGTNIDDKTTNTYSANTIDGLTNIETVTNDNGTAIKYPDGTMICTKRIMLTNVAVDQSVGQSFMSNVIDLGNFAVSFVGTPIENITPIGGYMCYISPATWYSNSACGGIRLLRPTSSTVTEVHINIVAYGRWKK